MRRKSFLIAGLISLGIAGVLVGLGLAVTYEPSFYQERSFPSGALRTKHSREFYNISTLLYNAIENNQKKWNAKFTESQINSYLAEDFVESRLDKITLPKGVSEPRIAIENDRIRLGFRYGGQYWSTVVSVDFRVWRAKKEANTVVVQLQGVYAGALPISSKLVMDTVTEAVRNQSGEIDISWFRHEGKLTAVLKFRGSQSRPRQYLHVLDVKNGELVVAGETLDNAPVHLMDDPR